MELRRSSDSFSGSWSPGQRLWLIMGEIGYKTGDGTVIFYEYSEHCVHEVLKDRGGIDRDIWLDLVFVVASWGHEWRLPLISLTNADEIICTV